MPMRIEAEKMPKRAIEGWEETVLVDLAEASVGNVRLCRWALEPGAWSPEQCHGDAEGFLYVAGGEGTLWVNGHAWPLTPETVVWLEPGDRYQVQAGEEGLEILYGAVWEGKEG